MRLLFLALTDTLYRSFYETFRDLAREHGVYIAAAMNAAPARRVEASEDPDLVALLGDPDEPGRDYVYEADVAASREHDVRLRPGRRGAGAGRTRAERSRARPRRAA